MLGVTEIIVLLTIAGFGVKRVVVRLVLLVGVTFTALSVPSFGEVMSLLGASTLTATSMVFPPIFYLFLAAAEHKKRAESDNVSGAMISGSTMAAHITLSSLSVDGILPPKSDEAIRKDNIGSGDDALASVPPLGSKIAPNDTNYESNDAEYLVGVGELVLHLIVFFSDYKIFWNLFNTKTYESNCDIKISNLRI